MLKKIIPIAICVVFALVVVIYYFGAGLSSYKALGLAKSAGIPGLKDGFTPQGLTLDKETDNYIISGYFKNKPSRIYVVKKSGEVVKCVNVSINGEISNGHFGGVEIVGDKLIIASDKMVYEVNKSDLYAENKDVVETTNVVETGNGCDFVTLAGDYLVVGEYYKKDKYETDESHYVKNNKALSFCYKVTNGVVDYSNVVAKISTPDEIQGMAVTTDGRIILSSSWGLKKSKLFIFNAKITEGETIVLDEDNLAKELILPSMAEEIVLDGSKLCINYESGSNKYKFFNRTRIKNIITMEV